MMAEDTIEMVRSNRLSDDQERVLAILPIPKCDIEHFGELCHCLHCSKVQGTTKMGTIQKIIACDKHMRHYCQHYNQYYDIFKPPRNKQLGMGLWE
jgi:hypothetical protein